MIDLTDPADVGILVGVLAGGAGFIIHVITFTRFTTKLSGIPAEMKAFRKEMSKDVDRVVERLDRLVKTSDLDRREVAEDRIEMAKIELRLRLVEGRGEKSVDRGKVEDI